MNKKTIIIGIAGNPNSGKTTIFNELTGSRHKVGNYPGVTVEKKEGYRKYKDYNFKIYDLPGTYSLTAYSLDELVARDFIINEKPDIIIDVMDSTNIERHLYLCLQIQEFGIPIIGALNMNDEAKTKGIVIDEKSLEEILGISMLKTVGKKGEGLNDLLDLAIFTYENKNIETDKFVNYGSEIEPFIENIKSLIDKSPEFTKNYPSRWLAVKLLEKDKNAYKKISEHIKYSEIKDAVGKSISWIEKHYGNDSEIIITEQRYGYIHGAVKESVKVKKSTGFSVTEKIDNFLLSKIFGLPFFLFIMWSIFQLTFKLSEYPTGILEKFFSILGSKLNMILPASLIKSLLVDGIIGGVGGMLVFLPNVLILFLCIAILEETGYMSRIAFLMDKFLHKFGLHGQSFIPFITGFGCSIPAILASRTLKNENDRLITVLVTPFFSCGARLPVYTLLISAFFSPKMSGNILFIIYLFGIILALCFALLFRKTIARGKSSPFVMELPPYRLPTVKGIIWHLLEKFWFYIKKAGTLIVAASIIIWFITNFPDKKFDVNYTENLKNKIKTELIKSGMNKNESEKKAISQTDALITMEKLEYSLSGRIGKSIEPLLKPIGFDWKIGIALITGFAAKELVVSTLGVLYKVSAENDEESLKEALNNDPIFNPLTAFVLMIFTLIYVPCLASLAVMKQELGRWKWIIFNITYTTTTAWIISFIIFNTGKLLKIGI